MSSLTDGDRLMDTKDILAFTMPTNEPDTAFDYILTSLDNVEAVAPISKFLINYQKPWTEKQIDEANDIIVSHGFDVVWDYNEYDIPKQGYVPFNRIRDDTTLLNENALLYSLTDDDMTFGTATESVNEDFGRQLLRIAHYMITHPSCGLTIVGSSLYQRIGKYTVAPTDVVSTYVTGKGIIARTLGDGYRLFPEGVLDFVGPDEEKVIAASRLYRGWYPAKIGFGKVRHYENLKKDGGPKPAHIVYNWLTDDILDHNNLKFIKDTYNSNYDYKVNEGNNLITNDKFMEIGGIDTSSDRVIREYMVDYSEMSNNDILEEIKKAQRNENNYAE